MWQMLVSWFKQRWQSGSLFKTTTLSWWSSGHKYHMKKKICEKYFNHSISILSDNYHLSIEKETEMKGRVSLEPCIQNSNNVWNFHCAPFFPHFFLAQGKKETQMWNGEITGIWATAYTRRIGIRTRLKSGRMQGIKQKDSFHAGRSFDSLLSRGCRSPIRLLVDPFGTLGCRWLRCGRRQAPLSTLI